jgi:hypothetical protein
MIGFHPCAVRWRSAIFFQIRGEGWPPVAADRRPHSGAADPDPSLCRSLKQVRQASRHLAGKGVWPGRLKPVDIRWVNIYSR